MSDSGLGDVFDAFEGSDMTEAARPGQPITEPDPNLQFVDTVTDIEEGIATPEKMLLDTAYGMEKLAELRAGGRPLTDLAAKGATELFDGKATDVWDKMRPENASPIDDAAGRIAVASEQLAGTTLGGIA